MAGTWPSHPGGPPSQNPHLQFHHKKTRIEVPITEQSMEYLHSKPSPRKDIRNKVGDTLKP